jgi:hypothetical protein
MSDAYEQAVVDAAVGALSEWETFTAADGAPSIRQRSPRTPEVTARAVINSVAHLISARAIEAIADGLQDGNPANPGLIGPIGLQDLADEMRKGA